MRKLIFVGLLIFTLQSQAKVDYRAEIYQKGTDKKEKVFHLDHDVNEKGNGLQEVKGTFTDLQGKVVFEETALVKEGTLLKTEISQKQTNENASIEVSGADVIFKIGDKIKKEKLGDNLIVTANFNSYILKNWPQLMSGKTIEFRYGVWARMETVGFKIFKEKEQMIDGQKVISIKMKPSSFIIAAIVKPLTFNYNQNGTKLISYEGRVSPKFKGKSDKWEDFDADVVYTYETDQPVLLGKVFFISPQNGESLKSPIKIKMGVEGFSIKPAGDILDQHTGHHHLIVDGKIIPEGEVISVDETHLHFGKGQTETELKLLPGKHTLTLQFADGAHRSYGEKMSSTISITVKK